ncbi:hypothetical protein E3P99_02425 [Wallemia hederae]|uniref:trimethyllysine dioxygenase n=1 Tax=Wallemia hederae TaxID=1540922 RepID=A0A4T0FLX7_9BASI|nr:hypothetical protein E3P99_02425 [Wallemia hederae]
MSKSLRISFDKKLLKIFWDNQLSSSYHNIWLRDHSRDPDSFHSITKQRLLNTSAIRRDIQPKSVDNDGNSLLVNWNDNTSSTYPLRYYPRLTPFKSNQRHLWDAQYMQQHSPSTHYSKIMDSDKGVLDWLQNINKYGIGFVEGVPHTAEHTQQLTELITFIRKTHYGEFWDFTSDLSHGDTAYTDIALGPHTDTTYFTDPIGLQLFHLLQPATVSGGDSLFIDGFHCANILKNIDIDAFNTLSTVPIPSHAVGSEDAIMKPAQQSGYPIINLDNITGELLQIRYNNDDRSVLNHLTPDQVEAFYRALNVWNSILDDERNQFWLPLQQGKVVLFDNWRILHGRSSFKGKRRLCGAYINRDDYVSRLLTLTEKHIDRDLRNDYGGLL